MKNAKRILEKFNSWKYDIYESNKSDWTKQDDKDVNEIEKLLEQQASERGYDRAFEVVNPYKDKLKKVLKICRINAKGWDAYQHDGKAEFKTICDLIEDKGWYKK